MIRLLAAALAISGLLFAAEIKSGSKLVNYMNIPLWEEGKVPLATGDGPLDKPFLTVFAPPEGKRNGTSMVIAPGGGNIMLMYGAEGVDIAERFNEWGVTCFVLTYRLMPKYNANARQLDAKRAIRLVRSHAEDWKLDPHKIGSSGYSAGGDIVRAVASDGPGDPNAADPVERANSKADYAVFVYGVGRGAANESLKDFPPTFLVSAAADTGASRSNAQLFLNLQAAGMTAVELHIYQKGRHGFGSGYGSPEFGDWMPRLQGFLKLGGFLPGVK